jgi:hypothetical protein
VILVPGSVGSFPVGVNSSNPAVVAAALLNFLDHEGLPPTQLTADINTTIKFNGQSFTIDTGYAQLITALENQGYQLGTNFFVAAQDWRLPIAPLDGVNDGWLSNLTPGLITSAALVSPATIRYSTQYLGYWLVQANEAYAATHGGRDAPYVDVMAHSEGWVITRAYISSPAYGGAYTIGGVVHHLPKIGQLIDLAGANDGVAQEWNYFHNNFYAPSQAAFLTFRFDLFQTAYYEVATLHRAILGANGLPIVTPRSITNPFTHLPDPFLFLKEYFRAGTDLEPTYPFLFLPGRSAPVSINNNPLFRSNLLLDLNAGPDPNHFASMVGSMTAMFGVAQPTITEMTLKVGPGGFVVPLTTRISGFSGTPIPTVVGQVWFNAPTTPNGGDNTVPIESLESTFVGDPRITVDEFTQINGVQITHISLLTDPNTQAIMFSILAKPAPPP